MPNYKISGKRRLYQIRKGRYARKKRQTSDAFVRNIGLYEPTTVPLMWPRLQTGFPQQMKVRLKYVDEYVMTSTAGAVANQAFRMNSVFDPDFTGVGHQPYGFDQYASLYNVYTVLGSKLTATWAPFTQTDVANPKGPWNVITLGDDDGSASANPTLNCEYPRSDAKILGDAKGSPSVVKTYATYQPQRDLGLNPYDADCSAIVTTNPSNVWYATCLANDINSTTSSLMLKVEIEFVVLFKSPKSQGQS